MIKIASVLLTLSWIYPMTLDAQRVVFDIPAIAGKTASEVEAVLGSPSGEQTVRNAGREYPQLLYRDGDVEIAFVDGKADWITLYDMAGIPFSKAALRALGLPDHEPTFARARFVLRWNNIPGYKEVNVFQSYVYVNVFTSP